MSSHIPITPTTVWEDFRLWLMRLGVSYEWADAIMLVVTFLAILLFIIVLVLALVLAERKILGWIQIRPGPNRVGPWGILQTVADALKLLYKEDIIPLNADKPTFVLAPIVMFVASILSLVVIPFGVANINGRYSYVVVKDLNIGLVYLIAVSTIGIIGIIMGGWASNNKYSLYGAMRSVAQLISYEVPMVLALISVALYAGSLSLVDIVQSQSRTLAILPLFPAFLIFLIGGVAETNRSPFDIPEAESELVGGFHTEYSGMKFALFFLAEYINIFVVSALIAICFLGGWKGPMFLGEKYLLFTSVFWFALKTSIFIFLFIWIRGTFPRLRVDQLMHFAWKFLVPVAVVQVMVVAWGVTYRNPFFSGNMIPNISVSEVWTPKAMETLTTYSYVTAREALNLMNQSEKLAFLWSVLGFFVLVVLLAFYLYRTFKGFQPPSKLYEDLGF